MKWSYSVEDCQLVVKDSGTGALAWQGRPNGCPVVKTQSLPDSDDAIVLLDYSSGDPRRDFRNILRCRPDGSVAWQAELPDPSSGDAYVDMAVSSGGVIARSWSGYRVLLDRATGSIQQSVFTK